MLVQRRVLPLVQESAEPGAQLIFKVAVRSRRVEADQVRNERLGRPGGERRLAFPHMTAVRGQTGQRIRELTPVLISEFD